MHDVRAVVRWGRRVQRSWSKLDRRIRWVSSRLSNWFKENASYVPQIEEADKGKRGGGQVLIGWQWPQVSLAADLNYSHVLASPLRCA